MEFKNTEVWGFKHAIRGMRNPMNSWDRSDSFYGCPNGSEHTEEYTECKECLYSVECNNFEKDYIINKNDMKLAQSLILAGGEHSKFLRMIHVAVNIDMPRYWWSEADTYHFNTKNSCSTMHKLLNNDNPITKDLFIICEEDDDWWKLTVNRLEQLRQKYKEIKNTTNNTKEMNRLLVRAKRMLPEGFLQLRTFDTNYAEIRNMYHQRGNHKLKEEWIDTFCEWVESLPYAEEFIMYTGE